MNEKEYLLSKADGVDDCVKWIKQKIKVKKEELDKQKKNWLFLYDDYNAELKQEIDFLVEIKIGLEKYKKKLKYMSEEIK